MFVKIIYAQFSIYQNENIFNRRTEDIYLVLRILYLIIQQFLYLFSLKNMNI